MTAPSHPWARSDNRPATPEISGHIELYRRVLLIRRFEERVATLYHDGAVPGFVHLCIGQEATAVGACSPLRPGDVITSTHRGHGHCLARGVNPAEMLAELMGKPEGTCRGLGGSMHIADPTLGVFGANGIVGAGLPIATGAATAQRLCATGGVVVAFFGDGAQATGAFHESVNLASVWRLPVIFFCENNHYAEFSAVEAQHGGSLADAAVGYGVEHLALGGNDVFEVDRTMTRVVADVRADPRPFLIEAETYRWHGHYEGDPQRYRPPGELEQWQAQDPVAMAAQVLVAEGCAPHMLEETDRSVQLQLDEAVRWASGRASYAGPIPSDMVTAPRPFVPEPDLSTVDGEEVRTIDAIRLALEYELERDPTVFLAGIDIAAGGGVFGTTRGLFEQWPDRVRDTPISETALMGVGVGAAMAGLRPIIELMYLDFLGVCFDQILNQAAKLRFMSGGRLTVPLTIRTQFGAGRSSGSQHSQSLEALLAHIPGLTVVMPSTPSDAYGLLRAAVADPNPVIVIENRQLYGQRGPKPPADHLIPIGVAKVVRPGSHATVVSYSRMLHESLHAAEELAHDGLEVEVIDLRTVSPLDEATVLASVSKTGRLLIAHEAIMTFGVGAELAALVADQGFWSLDAPIRRLGAGPSPAPYAPKLEDQWLPDRSRIAQELRMLIGQ